MSIENNNIGYLNKTGHYHNRSDLSAYESTDNCGTCDGALCDICRDVYIVKDMTTDKLVYRGPDKEKAIELAGYNFAR